MEQADAAERSTTTTSDVGDETAALQALLRWYGAMGVDAPIGDEPRDGFTLSERLPVERAHAGAADAPVAEPTRRRSAPQAHPSPGVPPSAEALVRQAEALAGSAGNLDDLAALWTTLPGCDLAAKSTGMIFSGGRAGAPLMLVGGAPDSDDERQAGAFAGAKGRLLDAMLRAIGLTRENAYLAHVVPWRPPGNRPPTPLEASLCLPFIRRQSELARPRVLLCLGERAAQPLLDSREPVSRLRGRFVRFEGDTTTVKTLVTFSLDYLLKQPLGKRRAWTDLQMIAEALAGDAAANGGAGRDRLEPSDR